MLETTLLHLYSDQVLFRTQIVNEEGYARGSGVIRKSTEAIDKWLRR